MKKILTKNIKVVIIVLFILFLMCVTKTFANTASEYSPTNNWSNKKFLQNINSERSKKNLGVLIENKELNRLAQERLGDMIKSNYFSHYSPNKKSLDDILPASDYKYVARGENLAYGEFEDEADITNSWMQSEGHKYNILYKKFKDIGVAYAVVDNYQGGKYIVVVNVFGSQKVDGKILAKR